jgi:hypothetical protein
MPPAQDPSVPSTTLHLGDRTLVIEAAPLAKSRKTRLGTITDQPRTNRLHLKQPIPSVARWLLSFLVLMLTTPFALVLGFLALDILKEGPSLWRTEWGIIGLLSVVNWLRVPKRMSD